MSLELNISNPNEAFLNAGNSEKVVSCFDLSNFEGLEMFVPQDGLNIIRFIVPKERYTQFTDGNADCVEVDFGNVGKTLSTHYIDGTVHASPGGWKEVRGDITWDVRQKYYDDHEALCKKLAPSKRVMLFVADYGDNKANKPTLKFWSAPFKTFKNAFEALKNNLSLTGQEVQDFCLPETSRRVAFTYGRDDNGIGNYTGFGFADNEVVNYNDDIVSKLPYFHEIVTITPENVLIEAIEKKFSEVGNDVSVNVDETQDPTKDISMETETKPNVETTKTDVSNKDVQDKNPTDFSSIEL